MISIITPSYNRAGMVVGAIESVLAQDYQAFEHIIVDGDSTDGTPRILSHYPHLKVIREPDQGMYDALNKGLAVATGEIIGFLNTDDLYEKNIFSRIVERFSDPTIMGVTGRAIVFSDLFDGKIKIVNQYDPEESSLLESLTGSGAFFNAWFFRKSTFEQVGRFNPKFRIAGDRDFMLRFALNGLKYTTIKDLVYKYRIHRDSLTFDKSPEKRTWSAKEHLQMTSFYLNEQRLPNSARKLLIRLRTSETVDMAARSLWLRDFRKFIYYLIEGSKYDPAWLGRLFEYIVRRGVVMLSSQTRP
ncbi:MAG TPA: glycosyltransferase family 2 protein [Chitinophagaceae bacterium]|nr:glycosyltransferase family 2 protein [Chitinophagaceae bacterium]